MSKEPQEFTPTQQRLVARMKEVIAEGTWEVVDGGTSRYAQRNIPTPSNIPRRSWPDTTYDRLVFLSVSTGKPWSIFLRVDRAPWVESQDMKITFKRAFEILEDPTIALDYPRSA